jgi:hypothetical protein
MYYFEWLAQKAKLAPESDRQNDAKIDKELGIENIVIYESETLDNQAASKLCASKSPISRGPVYVYNDNLIEIRSGLFETHRGYITIISLGILVFIGKMTFGLSEVLIDWFHAPPRSAQAGFDYGIPAFIFLLSLDLAAIFIYLKYGLTISRMELFTSRHLLIRFNRKTQQVYLHRPKSCGGIAILPWEGITSEAANNTSTEAAGLDVPLLLCWPADTQRLPYIEVAAVGKRGNNMSELRDEWEFIRRFMDEGPEGLPRPHITSHFPWPWQAFVAPLEGLSQYLVNSNKTIKWGMFFLWPAIFVFGFAHWISLLLCWKPRWPKVIREAGLPGKPVPPLTTLKDFPPHIQQRLRDNAHIWEAKPGSPPEKEPRKPRAKRKPRVPQADAES